MKNYRNNYYVLVEENKLITVSWVGLSLKQYEGSSLVNCSGVLEILYVKDNSWEKAIYDNHPYKLKKHLENNAIRWSEIKDAKQVIEMIFERNLDWK